MTSSVKPDLLRQQNVTTSDCAIAVAIPLTREEFHADIAAGPTKEYAVNLVSAMSGLSVSEVWSNAYGRFEAPSIEKMLLEASRRGVEVVRRCTMTDILSLVGRKKVVILIAHWRSGSISLSHIRDYRTFLSWIRDGNEPSVSQLRYELQRFEPAGAEPKNESPASLLKAIHDIMSRVVLGVDPVSNDLVPSAAFCLYHNRLRLNEESGGILNPTLGLEFSDSTISLNAATAEIPASFCGVWDLTICYSVLLGERLKSRSPKCNVASSRNPVKPLLSLPFTLSVFRQIERRPGNYLQLLVEARERLGELLPK